MCLEYDRRVLLKSLSLDLCIQLQQLAKQPQIKLTTTNTHSHHPISFLSLSLVLLFVAIENLIIRFKNMSWICKAGPTNLKLDTVPLIANQFRRVDPKTKQIYTEIIFEDNSFELVRKFEDWRRIKLQTIDTKNLLKNLRQSKEHFIDPTFPHNNSVLSKEFFHGEIEWKRVRDVVENAVYSKQQTIKTLQKTKLNRKQFEKALILISRSSPTLFKQIVSKTLNPEGLYEFKLFRHGYIRNVVIDDYIPTHQGLPLFVGPVRDNEVYAMLLEKAIAKVCGSYEQIPENAEQLLEIVFCGPVKTKNVQQLRESDTLGQSMKQCVAQHLLSVLVSKRDPKIRNYGLNQNQVYHLINRHQLTLSGKEEAVYELVSETKLSAWNGKYALNDQIWNSIDPHRKIQLYQQIKANRSFLMGEADLGRHFDELLIFQSMDINNKDWCQNESDNSFPSFTTFEVSEKDRVFIRVSSTSTIRQTLILVEQISPKEYRYVTSFFNQSTYKGEFSVAVDKGKYILATFHQWFINKHGKYFVFLSSERHINLNKGGVVDNSFLLKTLANYDEQITQKEAETSKLYKMRIQIEKFGLAWLTLNPNHSKSKTLKVEINHEMLNEDGWTVLEPYNNIPIVHFNSKSTAQESMIILEKRDIDPAKKYHFPAAAFKLKQ